MPEATFKIVYERTEKSRQLDKKPLHYKIIRTISIGIRVK